MFSRMKKYVSMALASTMVLTAAFSNVTSIMGATNVTVITGKDVQPYDGIVASDAPKITVKAPASVEAEEEFEVDFVVANNPGFSSYEFLIKYEGAEPVAKSGVTGENINDSKETPEPLIKGAVINAALDPATMGKWNGVYTTGYAKNDIDEPANAAGNGKLFSLKFKAKEAGSNVKISLQGDTMFLSSVDESGATHDVTFYVENAEVSVKSGPIKPVDPTISKITGKTVETVTEIPEGAPVIEVIPSNPTPALNEEIDVEFVISNNPGFSSYEFLIPKTSILEPVAKSGVTGDNINDSKETPEPLIKGAVINAALDTATMDKWNGVYTTGYAKNDIDEPANAAGNGKLFALKFKAVAEGSENIMLKGDTMFLSSVDESGATHDVTFYVKNGVVTVGGEADTTTETTTETTTVSTTEATTEKTTDADTETTTTANTETTTKDANTETTTTVVDPVTQTTTRKTDNDRGSGGGSPSKNYGKDTNKKDPSKDKEEDNKKDPSKEETDKKDPTKPTTPDTKVKFTDVGSNYSWAVNAINKLSDLGIINGVGDSKFAPQLPSKRGDFILMLTKVLGMKGTATSNFNDVPKTKYYYDAIGIAKDAGLAKGVGNNNFNPEGTITRQEMMTFVARALEYKNVKLDKSTGKLAKFSDASTIAPYAVDSVAALVNLGIVNGTGSKIEPARNITRAEMAVLMYNVYEYLVPEAFTTTTTEATTESTTEGETSTKKDDKKESTTKGNLVYKDILKEVEDAIDDFDDIKSDVEQAADDKDDDSIVDDYEDLVEKLDGLLTNVKKGEKYSQSKLKDLYDDVKDVLDEVEDFMKDYDK